MGRGGALEESGAAVSQTDSALRAVCRCLSGDRADFSIMKPGVQILSHFPHFITYKALKSLQFFFLPGFAKLH